MRITISIFLLILVACKSTNTNTLKTNEVSFKTVSIGVLYGDGTEGISKSNFSISNAKDWNIFLSKINPSNRFSKVAIDFSKQQLLCVFDSIRNTSRCSKIC